MDNGGCTDKCEEVGGLAVCSCYPNRHLANDKKTCTKGGCEKFLEKLQSEDSELL